MTETPKKKRPRAKGTGSVFQPKGSRFWWTAYYDEDGKRHLESSKSEKKGDAQTLLTNRLADLGKGIVVSPEMGKVTVGKALQAVIDNQKVNGRQSAAQTEQRVTDYLLPYFKSERRLNTVTTADLEAYQTHRLVEQKAERATVNRELAIVRRAFRLAFRGGILASMPVRADAQGGQRPDWILRARGVRCDPEAPTRISIRRWSSRSRPAGGSRKSSR